MGEDWHPVCRVDDQADDEVISFEIGEFALALIHTQGEFYATSDECGHPGATLSEGHVESGQIECPLHQCRYDVATGEAVSGPANADLAIYPVDTHEGWVYVQYVEDYE